jgi:hypothetical protein
MGNTLTKHWTPDNADINISKKTQKIIDDNVSGAFNIHKKLLQAKEKNPSLNISAELKNLNREIKQVYYDNSIEAAKLKADEIYNNHIKKREQNGAKGFDLEIAKKEAEKMKKDYLNGEEYKATIRLKNEGLTNVEAVKKVAEYIKINDVGREDTIKLQNAAKSYVDSLGKNIDYKRNKVITGEIKKLNKVLNFNLDRLNWVEINKSFDTILDAISKPNPDSIPTLSERQIVPTRVPNSSSAALVGEVAKTSICKKFGISAAIIITTGLIVCAGLYAGGIFDGTETTTTPSTGNTTTSKPSTGNITTPNPSQTGGLTPWGAEILTSLIIEKISGCYMFTNNGGKLTATRLDGCSDWYNNMDNQFYCSCFKTTDVKTLPTADDCKDEACNSPYCLNQSLTCQKPYAKKCNQQLYMCNGQSINDDGFVFYAYQYFPPEAIMAVLTEMTEEDNKSNIVPIIIGSVIIIVVILLIIYLMMNSKKGKKGRKNK